MRKIAMSCIFDELYFLGTQRTVYMSLTLVTYIAFVVAAFILVWGVLELSQRWYGRRRMRHQTINTWMPLKPTAVDRDAVEDPLSDTEGDEENSQRNIHSRAQQNGHYS